jgi:hypothetical protein
MATERYDEWLRPNCDLCGGLGAAVERRVVGDVMVDEAGHQWISPVRVGAGEPVR